MSSNCIRKKKKKKKKKKILIGNKNNPMGHTYRNVVLDRFVHGAVVNSSLITYVRILISLFIIKSYTKYNENT